MGMEKESSSRVETAIEKEKAQHSGSLHLAKDLTNIGAS